MIYLLEVDSKPFSALNFLDALMVSIPFLGLEPLVTCQVREPPNLGTDALSLYMVPSIALSKVLIPVKEVTIEPGLFASTIILPEVLVEKTPIDGLCGKTDEENLGFTYAELDRYIRTGEIDDPVKKEMIDRRHRANLFKLQMMPGFSPEI